MEQAFGPRPDSHMATPVYLPLLEGSSLCLPVPQPEARAKSRTIQLGSYQHEWTNPITAKEAMDSLFLNSSTPATKRLWGRATSLQATPPANYMTSERNIKSSDSSPPTRPTPSNQAASTSLIYDAAHTKQCNLIALLITRLQHARICSNLYVIREPLGPWEPPPKTCTQSNQEALELELRAPKGPRTACQ